MEDFVFILVLQQEEGIEWLWSCCHLECDTEWFGSWVLWNIGTCLRDCRVPYTRRLWSLSTDVFSWLNVSDYFLILSGCTGKHTNSVLEIMFWAVTLCT